MNHSTESCWCVLEEVYIELDRVRFGGVVSLDLNKAFDAVNHNILTSNSYSLHVTHTCLTRFEDDPKQRQHATNANDIASHLEYVAYGMPQIYICVLSATRSTYFLLDQKLTSLLSYIQ